MKKGSGTKAKPSPLVDTRVIYCGDNLEQLKKFPDDWWVKSIILVTRILKF